MTIAVKDIQSKIQKWAPFVGKIALIESTGYYAPPYGERPFLELQRNIMENARPGQKGEIRLVFGVGSKQSDWGLLGCVCERDIGKVMFEPEDVRRYAKTKIMADARFSGIAANKENLQIGQRFLSLVKTKTSISVEVVTVKDVSLKGVEILGGSYANMKIENLYGIDEAEVLFDEIMKRAEVMLENPISTQNVVTIPPGFTQFVVTTIERESATSKKVISRTRHLNGELVDVLSVMEMLDDEYSLLPANMVSAIIVDTKANEVHRWSK